MGISTRTTAFAAAFLFPLSAFAAPLALTPADPQPAAGALVPGLAVSYATGSDGRSLGEAKSDLRKAKPGDPIPALNYDDEPEGTPVLTSSQSSLVAAAISGYIKFDAPGTYVLDFLSNDGLEISIGGQQVGLYDGVHSCGYVGEVEVEVPKAGYYPLEATYFQRKGTACLMMEWGPDSDGLDIVPDSAFFHAK